MSYAKNVAGKIKQRACLRCDEIIFTDENWRLCKPCRNKMANGEIERPYSRENYVGVVPQRPIAGKAAHD